MNATGESLGRSILTELVASGASCASNAAAPRSPHIATRIFVLLCIYGIDRYRARFGIDITSPHGTLRIQGINHPLRAAVHQASMRCSPVCTSIPYLVDSTDLSAACATMGVPFSSTMHPATRTITLANATAARQPLIEA